LAQVFTFGAKKYEDNSWQELEDFEDRYLAAAHRHLNKHQLGELKDKESGLYSLDHALWNIAALRWKLEQEEEEVATIEITFNAEFDELNQENVRKFFKGHKSTLIFRGGESHPEAIVPPIEVPSNEWCTPEGIPKDEEGFHTVHDDVDTET
jgi:hypothetical protein